MKDYKNINNPDIEKIVKIVSNYYKIPIELIRSKNRRREFKTCRFFVFKYVKDYIGYSWATIGAIFDQDHTTSMNGYKTINNLIETEYQIRIDNDEMESRVINSLIVYRTIEDIKYYMLQKTISRQKKSEYFRKGLKR